MNELGGVAHGDLTILQWGINAATLIWSPSLTLLSAPLQHFSPTNCQAGWLSAATHLTVLATLLAA